VLLAVAASQPLYTRIGDSELVASCLLEHPHDDPATQHVVYAADDTAQAHALLGMTKAWYFLIGAANVCLVPYMMLYFKTELHYSAQDVGLLSAARPWLSSAAVLVGARGCLLAGARIHTRAHAHTRTTHTRACTRTHTHTTHAGTSVADTYSLHRPMLLAALASSTLLRTAVFFSGGGLGAALLAISADAVGSPVGPLVDVRGSLGAGAEAAAHLACGAPALHPHAACRWSVRSRRNTQSLAS
jgi:hypothetical protein